MGGFRTPGNNFNTSTVPKAAQPCHSSSECACPQLKSERQMSGEISLCVRVYLRLDVCVWSGWPFQSGMGFKHTLMYVWGRSSTYRPLPIRRCICHWDFFYLASHPGGSRADETDESGCKVSGGRVTCQSARHNTRNVGHPVDIIHGTPEGWQQLL